MKILFSHPYKRRTLLASLKVLWSAGWRRLSRKSKIGTWEPAWPYWQALCTPAGWCLLLQPHRSGHQDSSRTLPSHAKHTSSCPVKRVFGGCLDFMGKPGSRAEISPITGHCTTMKPLPIIPKQHLGFPNSLTTAFYLPPITTTLAWKETPCVFLNGCLTRSLNAKVIWQKAPLISLLLSAS